MNKRRVAIFTLIVYISQLFLAMPQVVFAKVDQPDDARVVDNDYDVTNQTLTTHINDLELSVDRSSFMVSQNPVLKLEYKRSFSDRLLGMIQKESLNKHIDVLVRDSHGKKVDNAKITILQKDADNAQITVDKNGLRPDMYSLEVLDEKGTVVVQDFSWGVLALNSNKSVYAPGDTAALAIAVLDHEGEMVCDADVTLSISDPNGSVTKLQTADSSIKINKDICIKKDATLVPDYETSFLVADVGTYTLTLVAKTRNGEYQIQDSINVTRENMTTVERMSATRLYPEHAYPMLLRITPDKDFVGVVTQDMPHDIEVRAITHKDITLFSLQTVLEKFDGQQKFAISANNSLTWNVNWKAGETYMLSYMYDVPDKSPEFYEISSLRMGEETIPFRSWQLAVDAFGNGVATRLSSIGFELQSVAAGVEFSTAVGSPAVDTTTYRSGAASLEVAASAAAEGMTYNYATANSADDYYLRAYINITTLPSAQTEIMTFRDSTPSNQASIRMNTDGTLEVWNEEDSAQVGSDSVALSTGRWYRIELRADATTIGSTVLDGRIDGVSFASSTVNHGNGSIAYALGNVSTSTTLEINFDDVALNNDSTTDLNWPGEGRIVHLKPNGDSTNTCSAGSVYASIDEITPNDATDTVLCDVANDEVGVQVEDSSTAGIPSSSDIRMVQVGYRWTGIDTSGAHSVHGRLTVGSTVEAGTAVASTTNTYYTNHNSFQNYQATFFDWTPATSARKITTTDLDSAVATFRTADATPDNRVSTLWLLVEYEIPQGGRVYSSGFELQSVTTGVEWTTATGTMGIDTTTKRSGAASLRITSLASTTEESLTQTFAYANGNGPYFARTYLYITTAPSAENRILELKNSSSTVIAYITLDSSRVLRLYDEDGQVTGTSTVPATTWTRVEIKLDASGSGSTDTVEAQMDGNVFATSATRNLSTGIDRIFIGGNLNGEAQTTGDWYFDDVAVNVKGAGMYQTDYPGPGSITHLRPNATGDSGSWAVSIGCVAVDYTCIDEVTPDDGTTAVGTTTVNQIEDVNIDSSTTGGIALTDKIKVISVGLRASNSSTTQNDVRVRLKAAASAPSIEGESKITNSTTYTTGRTSLTTTYGLTVYEKPNVNTAWTSTDLDAAQIGIREIVDSASNAQVSTLWMLVEYESPSGGRLYSSGFELNSATAGIEWVAIEGSPTVQGTTYRSGAYAGQITSISSGTAEGFRQRFMEVNTNGTYYLRTYLRVGTAPSAENRIIALRDTSTTDRVYLTIDSSLQPKIYDEDGAVGSVGSALSTDTWYRVEIKVDLTPSAGSHVVEAKIDGSAFATASNRNISTGVAQFRLGGNLNSEAQTTGNWYFDDVALNQNAGSTQNSYPGAGSIVHMRPNADGDTVAWTNTYTNLDEVTPNDATDMVESTTQDQIEEVNLDSSTTAGFSVADTVNLVSVGVRFRNDSITHFSGLRVHLKDAASATQVLENGDLRTVSDQWRTNALEESLGASQSLLYPMTSYKRPDGTNSWTATVLDSTQIGVKLGFDYNSNNIEVSTLWLLVDYSPPNPESVGGYSFQRKTWFDGTRYWRSHHDIADARIEFEYSSDGTSWTEDTSARISVATSDFSIYADSSNAFIVYTNGYDIEAREAASYPGTGFSWGSATVVYNGSSTTDLYRYPTIAYDSNSKIWISSSKYASGSITNQAIAASTDDATEDLTGTYTDSTATVQMGGEEGGGAPAQNHLGGFRFTSIAIPPKAIISAANADWMNDWTGTMITEAARIFFEAVDDAATFSSGTKPSTRSVTTAYADWSGSSEALLDGEWYSGTSNFVPPSVTSLLQEVVDRSGWASGNDIAIIVKPHPTGDNTFYFGAYAYDDAGTGNEPRFSATWTASQIMAIQATSANDIAAFGTAAVLDSSTNTNKYGVIVPRTSGSVFAVWMDGTAIESKNYNGSAWDASPTAVDTGLSGLTDTLSAVADSSGNVYVAYVSDETTDQISHTKWNGSSWTAAALVSDAASANDSYPTITLDTTGNKLYTFWIDTSTSYIYYASCSTSSNCDVAGDWDAETSWKTTGTNIFITSNYSGAGIMFAQWFDNSAITWDDISSNTAPSAPTTLYLNERATTAQSGVASPVVAVGDSTPVFSSVYADSDAGDIANKYEIIVYSDSGCTTSVWDSGSSGTAIANCTQGNRCADVTFGGTALPFNGTQYWWKMKYWDDTPAEGSFSGCTDTFTILGPADQLRHGNYFFNKTTERKFTW